VNSNPDPWEDVAKRLRSLAPGPGRNAILQIRVLVVNGCPVVWTRPDVTMLEPGALDPTALLERLSGQPKDG